MYIYIYIYIHIAHFEEVSKEVQRGNYPKFLPDQFGKSLLPHFSTTHAERRKSDSQLCMVCKP